MLKVKMCFFSLTTFSVHSEANSKVSALFGRIPSAVGYQPTLATDLTGLQERITTTKKGSITSVQAIYVPTDDLTDVALPQPLLTWMPPMCYPDKISELGVYPAVDPFDSTLRMLSPHIFGRGSLQCSSWCTEDSSFKPIGDPQFSIFRPPAVLAMDF